VPHSIIATTRALGNADWLPRVRVLSRQLTSVPAWPPVWFAAIEDDRTDIARNHDDLLAEGFGTAS